MLPKNNVPSMETIFFKMFNIFNIGLLNSV